ncbi:MAG: hypothetical protein WCA38_16300, partial [Candidatus Acidiferrales bacterium]
SSATEYQVAPSSSYVEATYKGTGTLGIMPNVFTMNLAAKGNLLTYQAVQPSLDEGVNYSLFLKEPPRLTNNFTDISGVTSTQSFEPENRKCNFTLGVSGRVENGKMVSGEIDDIQITHMSSLIVS